MADKVCGQFEWMITALSSSLRCQNVCFHANACRAFDYAQTPQLSQGHRAFLTSRRYEGFGSSNKEINRAQYPALAQKPISQSLGSLKSSRNAPPSALAFLRSGCRPLCPFMEGLKRPATTNRKTSIMSPKNETSHPNHQNADAAKRFTPITDWDNEAITEIRWVSAARSLCSQGQTHQAINATKYPWRDAFFEGTRLSADFKYFLGLVATDGHVRADCITLILQESDVQILEDLATWSSDTPRKIASVETWRDDKIHKLARLNLCGQSVVRMVRDLLRFEGNNKTKSLRPREFLLTDPHFLRGVFDGDGCVQPARLSSSSTHLMVLTSAAVDGFLKPLISKLETDLGIQCDQVSFSGHSSITLEAQFRASNARALTYHCYAPTYDIDEFLVLDRKREKARAISFGLSLRARPVWMTMAGKRDFFLDYQAAADALFASTTKPSKCLSARQLAQEISANFTKHKRRGHKICGATFEAPSIEDISRATGIQIEDLCRYNPEMVCEIQSRSKMQAEVHCDLSPIVIRYADGRVEKLYLNCADAAWHPALQRAGYDRGAVQNKKRQLKQLGAGSWAPWTLRATRQKLEVRLPSIDETLCEIRKRNLHFDLARVVSCLSKSGIKA